MGSFVVTFTQSATTGGMSAGNPYGFGTGHYFNNATHDGVASYDISGAVFVLDGGAPVAWAGLPAGFYPYGMGIVKAGAATTPGFVERGSGSNVAQIIATWGIHGPTTSTSVNTGSQEAISAPGLSGFINLDFLSTLQYELKTTRNTGGDVSLIAYILDAIELIGTYGIAQWYFNSSTGAYKYDIADPGPPWALGTPAFSVLSISPTFGPIAGGTAVTITGTGFGNGPAGEKPRVTFGGVLATSIVLVSATSITCNTPAHAGGLVDVVVTNPDGTSGTLTNGFRYMTGWWNLPTTILDGLRYRFSQALNWYRFQTASPGTGWSASAVPAPYGWFQSTDGFTGAATVITGGVPANPRSFAEITTFATGATGVLGGSPACSAVFDNFLVYPAKSYTVGTDLPPIRIFDGVSDREFVRLPKTTGGVIPKAVLSMIVANGTIYLSTFDSGTSSADFAGRVFALSLTDGTLEQVGDDVFTAGHLPYALAWHANQLWVGTHRQAFTATGAIYKIRPELTAPTWTKDADSTANTSVASLLSYGGQLYVGTMAAAASFAKVLVRDYAGVYTTSDTGTGGTAVNGNGYIAMAQFGDNLYAAFWNNDTSAVAKIRKFDGSTWSTAYSTIAKPFGVLFVDQSTLYAFSVGVGLVASLVTTVDGASWTDLTSEIVGSSEGLPLVGVVVR